MLSSKKVISLITGGLLLSSSLLAEVKFSGGAELDLFYKTNQTEAYDTNKARGGLGQEIAIVLNVDGTHEGNAILKTLKWRVASKLATDYRYDSPGIREAWIGTETDIGEFRAGNQFSNLYLVLDGYYSVHGSGNLMGDFGAHEVQYSRSLTYISPDLAGFKLSAQYDVGGRNNTNKDVDGNLTADSKILTSYATEVLLTYDSQYVRLDGGYYRGVNSGTMDFESDVFAGSKTAMGSGYATKKNLAEEFFAGTTLKLADFKVNLGYSHSHIKDTDGALFGGQPDADARVNKFLIGGSYSFLQKHSVGIGYVKVFDSRYFDGSEVVEDNKDGLSSYYTQYNYSLTDNISLFAQGRYAVLDTRGIKSLMPGYMVDGSAANTKNVARILVGTYISF